MRDLQSPLRYPGGKGSLADFVEALMRENLLNGGAIVEPYAGGAGLSLALLQRGVVSNIYLVEKDPLVYAFWKTVQKFPEELVNALSKVQVGVETWHRFQKYKSVDALSKYPIVELGLACLFLNRTNFSGIIDAKPIGGEGQNSKYKIDCRFNRNRLIDLIDTIARYRGRISVTHSDALSYLRRNKARLSNNGALVYIDPPYVGQGHRLYRFSYTWKEHEKLAQFVEQQTYPWIVSIDSAPEIRELYAKQKISPIFIKYAVKQSRRAEELIITNLKYWPGLDDSKVRRLGTELRSTAVVGQKVPEKAARKSAKQEPTTKTGVRHRRYE